jgi:hypothetical protein
MFIVEIYNKADFCNIVKRFVCADEGRANFWAGFHVDRLAVSGDEYDNFDYRVIVCEELK